MIKVESLNKYYKKGLFRKLHVINNTTLEIPDSGIIAVVGRSGVGKTTLLNTISGLDNFKNGTINFNDESTDHYNSKFADKLRMEHFGFVFQNYYLMKDRSVYDNVVLPLESFNLTDAEKKDRVSYVLKQLGISKYTNKLVSNLSGGEQQRVSIARALVKSPKVIFADEPTGSLDEMTTFNVLNILKKVSKTCAVFIVTHEQELISYYADYVIELDNGVVVKEYIPTNKSLNGLAVDQNIYLNELNNISKFSDSNVSLNLYSDADSNEKMELNIAYKNNKIYLESNKDIIYLDSKNEAKMIRGDRYKIEDYVDDNFNYSLPEIEYSNKPNSFKTILNKALTNYKQKTPFKTLLRIILILLSVVLLLLFESNKQLSNKDLSMELSSSKGNISISIQTNSYGVGSSVVSNTYRDLREKIEESNLGGETLFNSFELLEFSYDGFIQLRKNKYNLKVYDFKPTNYLSDKDLVYGSMPQKRNEIVIDEYVLNRFMYNNYLSNIITDYNFFIGKSFTGAYSGTKYEICGISKTQSPTIYGSVFLNFLSVPAYARYNAIDYDSFIKEYPEYSNISLNPLETIKRDGSTANPLFNVVGSFDSSIPYDYVIRKEDIKALKSVISQFKEKFYIVTDGSKQMVDSYEKLVANYENTFYNPQTNTNDLIIFFDDNYQLEFDLITEKLQNLTTIASLVSLIIVTLAVIVIIYTTNKIMVRQIGEIAIYRSLGYSKSYVFKIYLIELMINTILYVFITTFVSYFILVMLSIIPLIEYTIAINFINVLLLSVVISLGVIIIGVISILFLINKTPTQIYNTYNKKIEE